jgi:hypothetical protein
MMFIRNVFIGNYLRYMLGAQLKLSHYQYLMKIL